MLNTAGFGGVCMLLVGIPRFYLLGPKNAWPVTDFLRRFCHQRIPKNRNNAYL